jgi:hypothetical protein
MKMAQIERTSSEDYFRNTLYDILNILCFEFTFNYIFFGEWMSQNIFWPSKEHLIIYKMAILESLIIKIFWQICKMLLT